MIDSQDGDDVVIVVDLVDHPVHPASCRVESGKFSLEAPADAVGVVDQGTQHELDDRRSGAFCESAQLTLRWAGDAKFVGFVVFGHVAVNRARSSPPVM